jgi:hypothetical protein
VVGRLAALAVLAPASAALVLPLASASSRAVSGAPRVSTGGFTHVSAASATLEGSINPRGLATTYYFQYGPTASYGSQTPTGNLAAGTTAVKVQQTVSGLKVGYHYRLVASNANGSTDGRDRTFTAVNKKQLAKPGFSLPKEYAAIPVGGAFTLSGQLTGSGDGDRSIVLQESPYPYTTPFTDVGSPILTTSTGRFTFRVAKLTKSTKFRVSTVSGTLLRSLVVPQEVSVRVMLKVRSSSQKGLVRLYGTVAPAEVGARVFVEFEKPPKASQPGAGGEGTTKLENPAKQNKKSGNAREKGPTFVDRFTSVVKRGTKALSRFSVVASIKETGNYRVVVAPPVGPLVAGHSSTVLLHAPANSKTKKKKKK